MPSLLSLSPLLANHTFPRDDYELRSVAVALGTISELVEKKTVKILATDLFIHLLEEFKWIDNQGIRNQIYQHLQLWFLNGQSVKVAIDIGTTAYEQHPVPEGCQTTDKLEELWADEMGRLVVVHDNSMPNGKYCIGVACEKAFSDKPIGKYAAHTATRYFPLIGPENCDCKSKDHVLEDAYHYQVPPEISEADISFDLAKKNCFCLGATEVKPPPKGSHYKVVFPGERPWALDANTDPIPTRFLKQLEEITGHELPVIKYVLIEKRFPPIRLRI
jgi:hypothetical protein